MAAEPMAQRTYEERTLTGEVETTSRDGGGFKVAGEWINYGEYYKGPKPERGKLVEVVAKGKYARRIKLLTAGGLDALEGEAPPDFGEAAPVDDDPGAWGYGSGKGSAAPRPVRQAAPAPAPTKVTSRATRKAAALAASAHFHSGRAGEEGAEGDVYETAFCFLAWLEDGD